jgi:hypothetical protein
MSPHQAEPITVVVDNVELALAKVFEEVFIYALDDVRLPQIAVKPGGGRRIVWPSDGLTVGGSSIGGIEQGVWSIACPVGRVGSISLALRREADDLHVDHRGHAPHKVVGEIFRQAQLKDISHLHERS